MHTSRNITAATVLRNLIEEQELTAGSSLKQAELAGLLGMSRTPIRMALMQLCNDGLLESTANGGFALRLFNGAEVLDAIGLRAVLEGSAARLAAARPVSTEELDRLDACCGDMERLSALAASGSTPEFDRYLRLNDEFHSLIFEAAGSSALYEAYERLLILPFASPSAVLRASVGDRWLALRLQQGLSQHRAIVRAVRDAQAERAERLSREHVRLTQRRLETGFSTDPALAERLPGRNLVRLDSVSRQDRSR